jgi:riboflavin-specific deaminase-like protein
VDAVAAYDVPRAGRDGRPWLLVNMVTSLDGATSVQGRSAPLSNPADRRIFHGLRALADVILVGAGTVRAEGYGPPRIADDVQERRVLRGQTPRPRIAVVTRSLELDLTSPLFADDPGPIVITSPASPSSRRVEVAQRADLMLAGQHERVDLAEGLALLGEMGAEVVLCEGGPALNGELFELDLVDELCLTLAPLVVGGPSDRAVRGMTDVPRGFEIAHLLEDEGALFLRVVRSDDGDPAA